jgi:hypothetical protein
VRAGVGPEGKAEVIRELQASGGSRRDDVERRWWKRWTFLSDQDQVQRVMFVGGQSVVVAIKHDLMLRRRFSMTPSLSRPQTCPSRWAMARKRPSRLPVYLLVLDGCLRELTRFPRLCTPQLLSRFTPLPSEYLKEGLQSPTPEPPLGGALQRRLPPIRCWHLLPSSRDPTLTRLERRAHGAE